MSGTQTLDLVHELQAELGWTPEFATAAHVEYEKWLRLRAQAGDFQHCKLPPSRVVAMVWSLHRQWTYDYDRFCDNVGGFIHHFPPAMRMNLAREQAYAATLHTYKAIYNADPPSSYWGPAICPYKPLSSSPPGASQAGGAVGSTDSIARALPSLRRSPTKRDAKPSVAAGKQRKGADVESAREGASASEKPRVSSGGLDARPLRRNSKGAKDVKTSSRADDSDPDGEDHPLRVSKPKSRKRISLSSPQYVLKPLRPGEKRKRGRPSFSDYVLAGDTDRAGTSDSGKKALKVSAGDKVAENKAERASIHVTKRRKSALSPTKATSIAPGIAKKEKNHPKPFRRVSRVITSAASAPIGGASGAGKSVPSPPKGAGGGPYSNSEGKTFGPPLKRPRGRPRKDGSWPIARAKIPETASSKPAPSVPPKIVANVTPKSGSGSGSGSAPVPDKEDVPKPDSVPSASETKASEEPTVQPSNHEEISKVAGEAKTFEKQDVRKNEGGDPPKSVGGDVRIEDLAHKENHISEKSAAPDSAARASAMEEMVEGPSAMQKENDNRDETVAPALAAVSSNPLTGTAAIVTSNPLMSPAPMAMSAPMVMSTPLPVSSSMPVSNGMGVSIPLVSTALQPPNTLSGGTALGNDGRVLSDPVFGNTELLRDAVDMDVSLHAQMMRQDGMSNTSNVDIRVGDALRGQSHLGPTDNSFSAGIVKHGPGLGGIGEGGPLVAPNMVSNMDSVHKDSSEDQVGDMDGEKPFRRPRGRPRKDGTWPAGRSKPMNDEAVERVKDLSDPAPPLNFTIGPSGTV